MFERSTRLISENLARALNRRAFLKKAGEASFFGLAALAAGQAFPSHASADKAPPNINCAPPGPYCSIHGVATDGCHGAACFQHLVSGQVYQCQVYYQWYPAGCWTSASGGGYWTCCDCRCPGAPAGQDTCGCAQFSQTPAPRPDTPGSGFAGA